MSIYEDWIEASTKMAFWKAKELEERNEILEELAGQKDEGAVKKVVDGMQITATYKMNRRFDEAVLDVIYNDLSDDEKECINYKPNLVLKKYRPIEETGKSKLLDAVVLTPGQGTLKIKHL